MVDLFFGFSDVTVFFEVVDSVHDFRNQDPIFFLQIHRLLSNILQRIAGPCVFLDSCHSEADFERLERQEEAACEASCLDGFGVKPGFRVLKLTNIGGKSLIP